MERVEIFEVAPRDGLQNEKRLIPTPEKIALVDLLSQAGFRRIEVASFVSPKWVPQMADSADVLAGITRGQGISYAALTPNMKGLEGAIAARADEIAIFAAASEGFSKANLNCTIDESFDRFAPVAEAARAAGLPVRGYVSCVTDCPYDGQIDPAAVARVAERLATLGCYEVSLGDTIGQAQPRGWGRCWTRFWRCCQRANWRAIIMTRRAGRWRISRCPSTKVCGFSTGRWADWGAVPMPPARQGTSPPKPCTPV